MLDSMQIKTVIKDTLEKMGEKYYSNKALSLIYNTGLVESKYKYIMQKGGSNIARGHWQCEPWVAVSLCNDYLQYRQSLLKKVASISYLDWSHFTNPKEEDWKNILTTNIIAQIVVCRLHYWRVPKPLPRTIQEQSVYWKAYYNSEKGAGTPEHFIKIVNKYGK
tara:strand:- start:711 stop:1202 length:492 start_codon:yes stop_codon:yes gene_type:complete